MSEGVREQRRRATLAKDIAEQHSGALREIYELARTKPLMAVGAAVAIGIVVAGIIKVKRG